MPPSHLDKAGRGYSIIHSDTLVKQEGGTYKGRNTEIIREGDQLYLVSGWNKKRKKSSLEAVNDPATVNNNLNNAYYLDHYFDMSDELNKAYPLNHHSFRGGYYTWKQLSNTNIDHQEFKNFTDKRLKEIKDSVIRVNDTYVALTNYLVQNMASLDYNTVKDSLARLPAEYRGTSAYYSTVVNAMSRQKPAWFFQLAQDYPNDRSIIYMAADEGKEAEKGLKAVEGHDAIKKEFFKDRRFGKTMLLKTVLIYTGVAAGLTLLIASQ